MKKESLWTKEFIIVSVINFFVTLTFFLLLVTIAPYAKTEFNASTSVAGLVSSIFIIGSLLGRILAGRIISSLGAIRTLWIGLTVFAFASVLYFVSVELYILLANRLLHGIAAGFASTALGTVIAQILPKSRKGEGIGYYSLSGILPTAIGPFIGVLLLQYENGYNLMFGFGITISLLCLVLLYIVKLNMPLHQSKYVETEKGSMLKKFIEFRALPISFVALLIGFSYSGVMSFLTFFAQEINLVTASSYFFLVYAIVIIFTRPFTGKLIDRKGANPLAYPCLVIFAIGMTLFSQATTGWMLLLAAAFIGIGYGNFNSMAQTIAVKVTEPHRVGLATSTYFILFDIGLGVGPYVLGFLVPLIGYRGVFLSTIIVILLCMPLYYFLYGKNEKQLMNQ